MAKDLSDIRIGNAERDEAVTALGVHLSTGRLELTEYEERCGLAVAARTRSQLEALFDDLPAPHPDLSSATRPGQLIQKAGQLVPTPGSFTKQTEKRRETPASKALETVAGLCFFPGVPAAILLTIFLGAWWVFIPLGVVMFGMAAASEACKKPRVEN